MRESIAGVPFGTVFLLVAACAHPLHAQSGPSATEHRPDALRSEPRLAPPVMVAHELEGEAPRIDGDPGDPVWATGSLADLFVQFEPVEGAPATERTEARVIYGPDALYVAFWAYDSDPTGIAAPLARRDQGTFTDRVHVIVDSYFDRRTAFHFALNPAGVKFDAYQFEDVQEDPSWDAVWDGEAQRTTFGWTAEFRIPYSQLRFSDSPDQTWGIQFSRRVARKGETSHWAPISRQVSGTVSQYGRLTGIKDLEAPRRLELTPYTLARAEQAPGHPDDPFHRATATDGSFGADLKYGITGNLTLDMTLNPDFGQVEADPAQLNLTAFETYLPERRPFFLEGSNIYDFRLSQGDGDGANESLFYSRRIGRAPQGSLEAGARFSEAPDLTRILGAAKISGKTESGVSVGLLYAMTRREEARLVSAGGDHVTQVMEPLANYAVLRAQKDLREGRTAFGVIGTATARDPEDAADLGLRSSAYTGGVDFRHRFWDNDWEASGYVVGSTVRGSAGAIARTQRSPARYFQRPDAPHVTYDPERTSLEGWAGQWFLGKTAGGNWRVGTGGTARSPGFEPNDLGFARVADMISPWVWGAYDKSRDSERFNRWRVNGSLWTSYDMGGERMGFGGNVSGNVQFKNFWSLSAWGGGAGEGLDTRMLRGGPAFVTEARMNGGIGVNTDSRKPMNLGLATSWNLRPESGSAGWNLSPSLTWRPSGRTTLRFGAQFSSRTEDRQWVRRVEGSGDGKDYYSFGRLDQTTVGLTTRVDFSFTPALSLQVYANPFVTAGDYESFRRVADPRASTYASRFAALDAVRTEGGGVEADVDGDGIPESLGTPDFNLRLFNSNVVLRWEYRPGSALFLVWSQARSHSDETGAFDLDGDARVLFGAPATNVFLVKFSYWLSP